MTSPSLRLTHEIRLIVVLVVALASLSGCVADGAEDGVFAVRVENGALFPLGDPAGVPVWSPVDSLVAWGNEDGLFLRAPDDPGFRLLADVPVAGVPAWSPDGKQLAYIARDKASLSVVAIESGTEIFSQALDHRGAGKARFPVLTLGGPSWAPDGSGIAYVCWDGAGDEICLIRPDGTGWRQVTRLGRPATSSGTSAPQTALAVSNTGPPAWSPSGDHLAVAVYPERPGAPTGVFFVELAEGVGRRVSSLQPNSAIVWAPDGGSIFFSAFRRGRSDVFRVIPADAIQQRVTERLPDASRNPALSPDGSSVAVESGGGIVVLSPLATSQALRVPGLRSSYPSWSHDGTSIAFTATSDPIASYN